MTSMPFELRRQVCRGRLSSLEQENAMRHRLLRSLVESGLHVHRMRPVFQNDIIS